jgi:hypothetical protein
VKLLRAGGEDLSKPLGSKNGLAPRVRIHHSYRIAWTGSRRDAFHAG